MGEYDDTQPLATVIEPMGLGVMIPADDPEIDDDGYEGDN